MINNINYYGKNQKLEYPENSTLKPAQNKILDLGKLGKINYTEKDLIDTRIPLIIFSKDNQVIEKIKLDFQKIDPQNLTLKDLSIINGLALEIAPEKAKNLFKDCQNNKDLNISLNRKIKLPLPNIINFNPNSTKLDLVSKIFDLKKIQDKGINGEGVGVAVIDSGIAPHPDLKEQIAAFVDLVNGGTMPYDDGGHGTLVAGCIAGSGALSQGKYKGVAPKANLIGIKVFDEKGEAAGDRIINAFKWAIEHKEQYNIKVINFSGGDKITTPYIKDPIVQVVEEAASSGISVFIAAGNSGPMPRTIASPANAPSAITMGSLISTTNSGSYAMVSGTSFASPIGAAAAALLYQIKPTLNPKEVKEILKQTAIKLNPNLSPNIQGAGVADPVEAVNKIYPL
ncbi:MAG: S8 family serine peptidase [Armatimonadetes bacterium]|nr:S8 family serine peptidase [Armatimonadota bacterium]